MSAHGPNRARPSNDDELGDELDAHELPQQWQLVLLLLLLLLLLLHLRAAGASIIRHTSCGWVIAKEETSAVRPTDWSMTFSSIPPLA